MKFFWRELTFFGRSTAVPLTHLTTAIREVRFGSYSIRSTTPTDEVLRFRSIVLCDRFAPPPLWKIVIRPFEFLPADLSLPVTNCLSGLSELKF